MRVSEGDESGRFTLVHGDELVPIDHPSDALALVEVGEVVAADFGRFELLMQKGEDGKTRYRASAEGVIGPEHEDEELACWGLLALLGDDHAPRACFFCRWSEVEPSSGWGNLGCAVAHREAYHRVATSSEARKRKWGASGLLRWVDEWFSCDAFEVRPVGYGYRGRPG